MRGGLVVASDRRLLFLSRPLFPRRPQTLEVAYARLASVAGRVDSDWVRLRRQFADSTLWLQLAPADAGQELAQLVAWRAGFAGVDVLPAPLLRPGEFTM
jgi:hypothetical protein